MEENKIIEFTKPWHGYGAGEIAGFPKSFADKVIENGFAKAYKDETKLEEFFAQNVTVTQPISQFVEETIGVVNETKEVTERPKPKVKEKGPKS